MLCEYAPQNKNHCCSWKPIRKISGPSSSIRTKTTSTRQYSSGANLVPQVSFKTSGSPEAKSITPEKDHDVNMPEGGEAAVARGGGRASGAASSDGGSSCEERDATNGDGESMGTSSLDKMGEAVKTKIEAAPDDKKLSVKKGEDSPNPKNQKGNDGKISGDARKNKDATNDDPGGDDEAASAYASYPLLVGTLAYSDRDNLRRHIIRGNWKYENSHAVPPQRFELIRVLPPEENLEELPKDGEFNGSFNVQHTVKSSKGKLKMKNRAVQETGVKLTFQQKDGDVETFSVNGKGTNEYGVFELFGTLTKKKGDGKSAPTYSISVHKKYVAAPTLPSASHAADNSKKGGEGKKDKKRKLQIAVNSKEEEESPPPTELPSQGVCLRGRLVRNTSDELSLDNAAVHRITGLWAMSGLTQILDEPGVCEKFEYEHKCSGDSSVFPLSGRYTGFFYVSEGGERRKIAERDVTLRFRKNNAGYHNVEGRGSNIFGKYNITGTLTKEGTITLFRHFHAPKVKASTKSKQVKASVSTNGSSSDKMSTKGGVAVAGSSALLSFDDVNAPDGDESVPPVPPPDQAVIMRGILKIEDDGTHTCSGSWAMTNEHFQSGLTSKYHFGIPAHHAADDAKKMLERMKSSGLDEDDDRRIKNMTSDGVSPVTLANSTFPIDSNQYKGSFKLRKGATRTQTIVDHQIVLKYIKNTGGSYNVYGKGTNEVGTFDLVGTLILQGKSNGLMQLYRLYPPPPEPLAAAQLTSRKSAKVFPGSLTEKATPANSGPVPSMKPPERFIPTMSGLQRRESSRMSRLPSRLEEDDPEAQMDRLMERCRQILKELQESDSQEIFATPVDPVALRIPDYSKIIKNPMDLGTIKKKMDADEIDSPEEFASLVRLTFENAIAFNSMPDNAVHISARNLLVLFNKKFGTIDKTFNAAKKNKKLTKAERQELKRKEKEAAKEAKRKAKEEAKEEKERKRKAEAEASNESKRMKLENVLASNKSTMAAIEQAAPNDPDANMTRAEYNLLVQAIKHVQDQIVGLHKLIKKSSKLQNAATSSSNNVLKANLEGSSPGPPSVVAESQSIPPQPSKPKKKKPKKDTEPSLTPSPKSTFPVQTPLEEDLQPLSFEEQEALSEAINLLPERLLPGAMQIIREADFVNDDDDEIDLDIDQLDTKTQRKLQSFVMENVKTKKKKKQSKKPKQTTQVAPPAPAPAPEASTSPPPPLPEEEEKKPPSSSRLPGGKSFGLGFGDDDEDSEDDKDDDDDEDEDLKDDFTNWAANPPTQDPAEDKNAGESDKNDEDDLWDAARKEAEVSKAAAEDRAKREEKMRAEAEMAAQRRMAEAAALGEQARAKREEEEAAEARLREEQEREAEEARKAAREKALEEVNNVNRDVDIGDAQRDLMKQYEQEYDNYSAGASPSSDFGF